MQIPYLSGDDLNALQLTTHDVVNCIKDAIIANQQGTVWSAPKAVITTPNDGRYMMAALAAMDNPSILTVKTVVLNPDNPKQGLPQINGLVTMLSSETGLPIAILDGNWITAVRTAGLSAVAASYMAREQSSSVGFVGCGVQACSHLDAFKQLFPLKRIKLFGRSTANQTKLSDLAKSYNLDVEVCDSAQQAIEGVDLVVTSITATGNPTPFLDANGLKQGAFVTGTDLGVPWIDESLKSLETVVIDDLNQEVALPNKLCSLEYVTGDLSGLVLNKIKGRTTERDRTAFIFRGHALGDLALSVLALQTYNK